MNRGELIHELPADLADAVQTTGPGERDEVIAPLPAEYVETLLQK